MRKRKKVKAKRRRPMTWRQRWMADKKKMLRRLPERERALLVKNGACDDACEWIRDRKFKSLAEAWAACENPGWMAWLGHYAAGREATFVVTQAVFAALWDERQGRLPPVNDLCREVYGSGGIGSSGLHNMDTSANFRHRAIWALMRTPRVGESACAALRRYLRNPPPLY